MSPVVNDADSRTFSSLNIQTSCKNILNLEICFHTGNIEKSNKLNEFKKELV